MATVFHTLSLVTMEEFFADRITPVEAKAQLKYSAQTAFELEMQTKLDNMKRSFGHVSAYDDSDRHYESHPRASVRKAGRTSKKNL